MRRKDKPPSGWDSFVSFPRKFSYEVDASVEQVVRQLGDLEQEAEFFRRSSQEISVMPVQDHYVFRVRRRRHGTLTVSAEGQIWQDETGCVIVEGETRVNGWSWIAPLVIMSLIGIATAVVSMPASLRYILLIPFFISMIIGFGMSFMAYRRDRNQLTSQFDEIMTDIQNAPSKQKRSSRLALEDSESIVELHETSHDNKTSKAAK
jgi:hypothetical protein